MMQKVHITIFDHLNSPWKDNSEKLIVFIFPSRFRLSKDHKLQFEVNGIFTINLELIHKYYHYKCISICKNTNT